jgi:hypothetical protein
MVDFGRLDWSFDNLKRTFDPLLVVLSTTLTSGRLHRGHGAAGLIVVRPRASTLYLL